MSGEYVHSLVATDVYSGWTEAVPLWGDFFFR